jgi:hypothetical protein
MTATHTFDVFQPRRLRAASGNWINTGVAVPEPDHRLALYGEAGMVFGANVSGVCADAGLEHRGVEVRDLGSHG